MLIFVYVLVCCCMKILCPFLKYLAACIAAMCWDRGRGREVGLTWECMGSFVVLILFGTFSFLISFLLSVWFLLFVCLIVCLFLLNQVAVNGLLADIIFLTRNIYSYEEARKCFGMSLHSQHSQRNNRTTPRSFSQWALNETDWIYIIQICDFHFKVEPQLS